jgi:predicted DNA-binding protein
MQIITNQDDGANDSSQTSSPTTTKVTPDPETLERLKNLAYVGNAIYSTVSETSFDTDFYLAIEALNKFKEGINKLILEDEIKRGIDNLIVYLQKKIDRRMTSKV